MKLSIKTNYNHDDNCETKNARAYLSTGQFTNPNETKYKKKLFRDFLAKKMFPLKKMKREMETVRKSRDSSCESILQ